MINFNYESQPKDTIWKCNLCSNTHSILISKKDRYGFNVSVHLCLNCGLIYFSPRMKPDGYKLFYRDYYRPLVSSFYKKTIDANSIKDGQKEYSHEIIDWIFPYIKTKKKQINLLDIGGSTGVVALTIKEDLKKYDLNIEATVIDPSPTELSVAKKSGLNTIEGLIEEVDIEKKEWDLILLCQTVDHLLDVKNTIKRIRDIMSSNSLFFIDIVDIEFMINDRGLQKSLKIDHPYNFSRNTIMPFLQEMGLSVIAEAILLDGHLIGFLCVKSSSIGKMSNRKHAEKLLGKIRSEQAQNGLK